MPRTFTLRELLIVVTLACVVCWFVASYPTASMKTGLMLTYFLPGFALGGLLSLASSRRRRALAMALLGSVGGFVAAQHNLNIWGDYNLIWWEIYPMFFLSVATYTTVGAVLGGVTAVIVFPRNFRRTEKPA